jgi:hypothetical protein
MAAYYKDKAILIGMIKILKISLVQNLFKAMAKMEIQRPGAVKSPFEPKRPVELVPAATVNKSLINPDRQWYLFDN